MFCQIFLSPQVKRCAIITYTHIVQLLLIQTVPQHHMTSQHPTPNPPTAIPAPQNTDRNTPPKTHTAHYTTTPHTTPNPRKSHPGPPRPPETNIPLRYRAPPPPPPKKTPWIRPWITRSTIAKMMTKIKNRSHRHEIAPGPEELPQYDDACLYVLSNT